jgi:hypothetical protein
MSGVGVRDGGVQGATKAPSANPTVGSETNASAATNPQILFGILVPGSRDAGRIVGTKARCVKELFVKPDVANRQQNHTPARQCKKRDTPLQDPAFPP